MKTKIYNIEIRLRNTIKDWYKDINHRNYDDLKWYATDEVEVALENLLKEMKKGIKQ